MQPAARDEPQWAEGRSVASKINFDIVVPCNSLILSPAKGIQVFAVKVVERCFYVIAQVIDSVRDGTRWVNACNCKLHGRNGESLIGEDLCTRRMIDSHQRQRVIVIRLPKLAGDAQIVEPVVRDELIAANLIPLFCSRDAGRANRVDAQAESRA